MFITSFSDLDAAEHIDFGRRHVRPGASNSEKLQNRSGADLALAIISLTTAFAGLVDSGLSFFQPDPNRRQMRITIKNEANIVLVPTGVFLSSGNSFYGKMLGIVLPEETSSIFIESRNATQDEEIHLNFAAISVDDNIINDFRRINPDDITIFTVIIKNNAPRNLLELERVVFLGHSINRAPRDRGSNNMAYFSFEGHPNRGEPSFGLCHFDTPSVTTHGQIGESTLTFTASNRRSSVGPQPINPPFSESAREARVFLNDLILSQIRNNDSRSFIAAITLISALAGLAATGISLGTSFRDSRNNALVTANTPLLSLNVKNLSKYTLYVLRTINCNSAVRNEGIIAEGETVSLPLTIGSSMRGDATVFMRLVLGDGRPNLDISVTLRDYGNGRFLKVQHVHYNCNGITATINDRNGDSGPDNMNSVCYRTPDNMPFVIANMITMGVTHGGNKPEINLALVTRDR